MNESNGQFDELGRLTAALCDGEITPEQAARLELLVSQSEAAQQYFLDYAHVHGALCAWCQQPTGDDPCGPPIRRGDGSTPIAAARGRQPP